MKQFIEEDEIDLRELFNIIWQGKWKISIFTFLVVSITIIYIISIPNSYKSEILLVPTEQNKGSSLGGLSALAGFAGVNLGSSGGGIDTISSFQTILQDYSFLIKIIRKHNLKDKFQNAYIHYIFPFGLTSSLIYDYKNPFKNMDNDEVEFSLYKKLLKIIDISQDKKTNIINLSVETENRYLSKYLVDILLVDMIKRLRLLEMKDINKQIDYYEKIISKSDSIELKQQIGQILSGLFQKKVLAQANELYTVSKFTESRVKRISEKSKPKRALIIIVAFITSIILAIFGLFFMEFLKND
jgi:uncharacterized protein involved in exopolysaccharide biosynthesis